VVKKKVAFSSRTSSTVIYELDLERAVQGDCRSNPSVYAAPLREVLQRAEPATGLRETRRRLRGLLDAYLEAKRAFCQPASSFPDLGAIDEAHECMGQARFALQQAACPITLGWLLDALDAVDDPSSR